MRIILNSFKAINIQTRFLNINGREEKRRGEEKGGEEKKNKEGGDRFRIPIAISIRSHSQS
jgi:hypothetical protein